MIDLYPNQNALDMAPAQNTKEPELDVYDELFNKRELEESNKTIQSISLATKSNPAKEAEAKRLGREVGVEQGIASRNLEQVREQAKIIEAERLQLSKYSPILARQLRDVEFAKLAYNDLHNLQNIERSFAEIGTDFGVTAS